MPGPWACGLGVALSGVIGQRLTAFSVLCRNRSFSTSACLLFGLDARLWGCPLQPRAFGTISDLYPLVAK